MTHVPLWPRYRPKRRTKMPALLSGGTIYDHLGATLSHVTSHGDCIAECHRLGLDLYVGRRLDDAETGYPWLKDAMEDGKTIAYCLAHGRVTGLAVRGVGNKLAWINPTNEDGCVGLRRFVDLGDYLGTGCYRSMAGFGYHLMSTDYFASTPYRQSAPNIALRTDLLDNAIGGRVDTPALGEYLEIAYEEDLRSAYPNAAAKALPRGTATGIVDEDGPWATWFARCQVTVPMYLVWSPILVRGPLSNEQLVRPGIYETWLWKEEADEARKLGIAVGIQTGWAWERVAPLLAPWVDHMQQLREKAPTPEIAQMVKGSTVGAIGRHGMSPYTYTLLPNTRASVKDQPYIRQTMDPVTDYSIHKSYDTKANALTYWHSYITMTVRLALYRQIISETIGGNRVLATDYDAIRLERPPTAPSLLWREITHTNLYLHAPRWVESDQSTKTPGLGLPGDAELEMDSSEWGDRLRARRKAYWTTHRTEYGVARDRGELGKFWQEMKERIAG